MRIRQSRNWKKSLYDWINCRNIQKSASVWVETSLIPNWILQQQNKEAREIGRHFNAKRF